MQDTTNGQAEQAPTTEMPGAEAPTPDEKSHRDELMEASQQFLRTLFRTGVHLAMTPVSALPEEPRAHFLSAGREFTQGLATLAQELSHTFDKMADEVKKDVKKDVKDN